MKTRLLLSLACAAASANLYAAPVTNWHTFKAAPATTLSGQGTASPSLGSPSLTASAAFFVGYFDALSLTNTGDRITFSYQVSFTDTLMSSPGDNYRFAMFDLNGQTPVVADNTATAGVDGQTDNWRGYWFGQKGGGGAGDAGSIRERIAALASGDNIFAAAAPNNTSAPSRGAVGGTNVVLVSGTTPGAGPTYTGVMIVEKTPTGIALGGWFGGNGSTNLFGVNDDTAPSPVNYSAVAWLNGGPLSCDEFDLQNVAVNYSASNALTFVTQPASATVNVNQAVTFRASWTGSGLIPFIQWRENGVDIANATNASYTIASPLFAQNGFTYSVVVSNVFGNSITSTNATLTVNNDTTLPTVLSVSSLTSNTLNVIFSEPVDPTTAQDGSSYSLAGNSFSSYTLIGGTNVLLVADALITGNYTFHVQNVKDTSGNTMIATNLAGIAHGFQDFLSLPFGSGLGFALNDKPVVYGSGADIFGTSDQFGYVYKPVSGDFDIAVRVESLQNTDANAKAGLMARMNIFSDSRNVMVEATPARFIFQYRTNSASPSDALTSPRPPTSFPNSWVRLKRSGSVISGYSGTNFGSWNLMGSLDTAASPEGAYPSDILIGLAVTSHSASQVAQAVFSGFGNAVVSSALTILKNGNDVNISWDAGAIGLNLQATPSLTPPVTWTNVPNSNLTNFVTRPSGSGASYFRLSN